MLAGLAADAVVVLHFLFIVFVVLGGLSVLKWPWLAWLHLPAATWGALISYKGWVCPLTPLENRLRLASGDPSYSGGFVEHYIIPVIYPPGLTPGVQLLLAATVVAINVVVYGWLTYRLTRRNGEP